MDTSSAARPPAQGPVMAGRGSPGLIFTILAVGVFLAALDSFIVNIAFSGD